MLPILASCALAGLACGLLRLNWFGLAALSALVTAILFFVMPWDLLLLPKWLASLLVLQLAWLVGTAVRIIRDDRSQELTDNEDAPGAPKRQERPPASRAPKQ
jgi:hypothetical protein